MNKKKLEKQLKAAVKMYKKRSIKKLYEEYEEYCKEADIKPTSFFAFQCIWQRYCYEKGKCTEENFREWVAK